MSPHHQSPSSFHYFGSLDDVGDLLSTSASCSRSSLSCIVSPIAIVSSESASVPPRSLHWETAREPWCRREGDRVDKDEGVRSVRKGSDPGEGQVVLQRKSILNDTSLDGIDACSLAYESFRFVRVVSLCSELFDGDVDLKGPISLTTDEPAIGQKSRY